MEYFNSLTNCILFSDLEQEEIVQEILPHGEILEFPKGQNVLCPQEYTDRLGVVLNGKLQVMHLFEDGSHSLSGVLCDSDAVGSDLICTKSKRAPYYITASETSLVIFFPAEMFLAPGTIPEAHRQLILQRLLTLLSHDNIKKEYRFAILSRKGLRERIITYLSMQVSKRGTDTITIPFSREEMASHLCVNRSALSHELSLMRQEGLIAFRKNRFTLVSWKKTPSRNSFKNE